MPPPTTPEEAANGSRTRRRFLQQLAAVGVGAAALQYAGLVRAGARDEPRAAPAPSPRVERTSAMEDRRFDFRLLQQVLKRDPARNVAFSPLSVGMALAMTYNGAAGETREAMARVLGVDGRRLEAVNQAYAGLRRSLEATDADVQLSVANSLWARRGVAFRPEFLERSRAGFGAHVTDLDFDDSQALETINAWVAAGTRGKIARIVDRIDPLTALFLINAVYFKGTWQARFQKTGTKEEPFHRADGREKPVPMMSRTGDYAHFQGDGFQAIRLPYGKGRAHMEVFLPDRDASLDRFTARLSAEEWGRWMPRFEVKRCFVKLPRFKLEYDTSLNAALQAMGMEVAFDPYRADFSGMSDERLHINAVKHKSFVEVNEEGTEAAAATSVEMALVSMRIEPEPLPFVVDRPFFFAIRDSPTGALLFLGVVRDPA